MRRVMRTLLASQNVKCPKTIISYLPSTFFQQRTSSSLKKVQMVDYNSFTQVFDTRELTGMTTTLK